MPSVRVHEAPLCCAFVSPRAVARVPCAMGRFLAEDALPHSLRQPPPGVAVLAKLVNDPAIIQKAGVQTVQAISGLLPGLGAYAALFFIIPALRWLGIQRRNAAIEERNDARRRFARFLASPSGELKGKLQAAQSGARLENVRDRLVYSSDKSVEELEAAEFDRRLNGK